MRVSTKSNNVLINDNRYLITSTLGLLLFMVTMNIFTIMLEKSGSQNLGYFSFVQISIILYLIILVYMNVRNSNIFVASPIFIFFITIILYHGLGPLLYVFGNDITKNWVNNRYFVNFSDLLKVNIMVQIGIIATALGLLASLTSKNKAKIRTKEFEWIIRNITIKEVVKSLLIVGIIFKYLIVFPYMMGLTGLVLPGSILAFSNIMFVAIFLMSHIYYSSSKREYRKMLYIICTVDIFAGLLVMSKLWIILPIIAFIMGKFLSKVSIKSIIITAVALAVAFSILTPFILTSRKVAEEGTSNNSVANSFSAIFNSFNNDNSISNQTDSLQWSWIRINYVPEELFAMDLYDNGSAGNTIFKYFPWVFIPRIIYPDKPVNSLANQFSIMLDGNQNNNESCGIYAEAYWDYGWLGIIFIGFFIGFLLGKLHNFSMEVIKQRRWLLIPLVVNFYLVLGKGINGFLVDTYIVQLFFALIQQGFIFIVAFFVMSLRKRGIRNIELRQF